MTSEFWSMLNRRIHRKRRWQFCNLASEIYCKIWQTLPTIGFLICCINHRFHHVLVTLMQTTLEYPFSRDSWRIHIIFWAEGEKNILSLITIRQNVYTYYVISKPRAETRIDSDAHSFYIRRNHFVIDSSKRFPPTMHCCYQYSDVDMNKAF